MKNGFLAFIAGAVLVCFAGLKSCGKNIARFGRNSKGVIKHSDNVLKAYPWDRDK